MAVTTSWLKFPGVSETYQASSSSEPPGNKVEEINAASNNSQAISAYSIAA
jgi:hypothetical protein